LDHRGKKFDIGSRKDARMEEFAGPNRVKTHGRMARFLPEKISAL
jgi:hypothetical protein